MGIGILNKAKEIGAGIKDAFTGAGDGISTVINAAKGQIPPDVQGELEKAAIELKSKAMDAELAVLEMAQEAQKTVYDFSIQYEGTASQVPKAILILRTVIRPIVTICMFFSLMFFLGIDCYNLVIKTEEYKMILSQLPQAYWVIQGIVLGFWFGGKAGENIADKLRNNSSQ